MRLLSILGLLIVVALVPARIARAAVVVVDDDGVECPNRSAATIQAGVALANPGDTVRVCAGTYAGDVVVNKIRLRLVADGPAGAVKVVGPGPFGFALVADDIRVEGFEIFGFASRGDASGIFVGGLFAGDTLNRANGAVLERNDSHHNAVGIYLWQSNRNQVRGNTVHHNVDVGGQRPSGTGIASFAGDAAQVLAGSATGQTGRGNDISQNVAHDNFRLGILVGACTSADLGCVGATGTARADVGGTAVRDNELFGNSIDTDFSALAVADATGGALLADNYAHDNLGTGIGVFFSDTVDVRGNAITGNAQIGIDVEGNAAEPARSVALVENVASGNAFGIFVTASREVAVVDNTATDNGFHGIFVFSAREMVLRENHANHNARVNPTFAGIRISGAANLLVLENETNNNGRGIRVSTSDEELFADNSAFGNSVFDLDWDGAGKQAFRNNHCATARPSPAVWDCRP